MEREPHELVLERIEACEARGLRVGEIANELGISGDSVRYYKNRDRALAERKKRHARSKSGPSCDESDKDIFETDRMARLFAEAIATQAPGRY